ncbi:hypothetical protein N431DRAFT_150895 [Stipitochalara longipes BDJ]|nr:hypothetical protein N431DRAFT_150895 [Stipitochalara longipes BDJ]
MVRNIKQRADVGKSIAFLVTRQPVDPACIERRQKRCIMLFLNDHPSSDMLSREFKSICITVQCRFDLTSPSTHSHPKCNTSQETRSPPPYHQITSLFSNINADLKRYPILSSIAPPPIFGHIHGPSVLDSDSLSKRCTRSALDDSLLLLSLPLPRPI